MAETVKIRVDVEHIDLEVNDNGDIIRLPVGDELFIKKLYTFTEGVATEAEKLKDIDKEDVIQQIEKDIAFHKSLKERFNELFGTNAYEKVYGEEILVSAEYVIDFVEQCLPYIQKYVTRRNEKLNKYSADRVGSSL